jgi:hypothetical protein
VTNNPAASNTISVLRGAFFTDPICCTFPAFTIYKYLLTITPTPSEKTEHQHRRKGGRMREKAALFAKVHNYFASYCITGTLQLQAKTSINTDFFAIFFKKPSINP